MLWKWVIRFIAYPDVFSEVVEIIFCKDSIANLIY